MAAVTLMITLLDHEAHALAIIAASLGPEQFESAYQHWLNHWKANDIYSPQVEANMNDVMGEVSRNFTRRWLMPDSMCSRAWDPDHESRNAHQISPLALGSAFTVSFGG
jgi:hypothetical protein